MPKVLLALAMVLVGSPAAWAHSTCGLYQTPGRYCTATRHEHVGVFERGGAGNPDTTLIIDGPAVERTPILHHDHPHNPPRLRYFFRIVGDVQASSVNPDYAGRLYISFSGDGSSRILAPSPSPSSLVGDSPHTALLMSGEANDGIFHIDLGIMVGGGDLDGSDPTPFTIRVWWTPEPAPQPEPAPGHIIESLPVAILGAPVLPGSRAGLSGHVRV